MIRFLWSFAFLSVVTFGGGAWGYEGPRPLKDIKVDATISYHKESRRYKYRYRVGNPKVNNGAIIGFNIFLPQDPKKDLEYSNKNYSHCKNYFPYSSENGFEEFPGVVVGSNGPENWACGPVMLWGESENVYRWVSLDNESYIDPGENQEFLLISEGLPAIRRVKMNPVVDTNRLPGEYEGNFNKLFELEQKISWTGKTVGPKAPPKAFDPTKFIRYIESLLEESSKLGWIKDRGVENTLYKKLRAIEKQVGQKGNGSARKLMENFLKEVKKLKGKKGFHSEAHALLYYNGQYFLNHLKTTDKGR